MALPNLPSPHILLIEDDPAVAHSLQTGLGREGYTVTWKSRLADGEAFARQSPPHLVLLDVRLPDGSGFDGCRRLRQAGLRMPVILLTVQREEVDKVLGLEMGADDYVTKPYSLRELLSRIRAQLRRAYGEFANPGASDPGAVGAAGAASAGAAPLGATDPTRLYAGDLLIDLAAGQVWRGRQPLSLTPTELRLLVYLARHRGQVLSRPQIVAAVWGHSPDLDSEKTVNVHIRRLREKVELDPTHPALILTVPGLGYRLAG